MVYTFFLSLMLNKVIFMSTIQEFLKTLQGCFQAPLNIPEENTYLDLSLTKRITAELLTQNKDLLPAQDLIAEGVCLVIETLKDCHLTKAKLGINELLKAYLLNINEENQEKVTEIFLDYLYEIYLYSLKDSFPYTDLLWGYLSQCFFPIAMFLIEEGYIEGCQVFLLKTAYMGKIAAQKGLHTSSIQEFLHTLELRAQELGYEDLGATAKNHRFNLELF